MVLTVPVKDYFEEYCYFYVSDSTRHGFIIDPGAQADKLLDIIRDNGLVIEKILLTHGHFDHFGAVEELREKLNCPVLAHEKADLFLLDPLMNLSRQCVGDTIFKESIGNYTFPGGNKDLLIQSIMERVFTLPDDTVLYSGHSEPTTVGAEKRFYGM